MQNQQKLQQKSTQNKFRFVQKIGSGAFADVIQAENTVTHLMVAIKRMKQTYKTIDQITQLREIQSLKALSHHPNIVKLLEILFDKQTGRLALVFELMSHDMYQTIKNRKNQLPPSQIKWYIFQILNGLRASHQQGFFHRDMKPENILVLKNKNTQSWQGDVVKLSDFGSARQIGSELPYTEYISTRWYRPPETLLSDGVYSQEMDIFGTGCIIFELIELHPIFPGKDEFDQISRIHNVIGTPSMDVIKRLRKGAKNNPIKQEFSTVQGCGVARLMSSPAKGIVKLIEAMLQYDPKMRISAQDALAQEYFDDFLDVVDELRKTGYQEESYLQQMENAWRSCRGQATVPEHQQMHKNTSFEAPAVNQSTQKKVQYTQHVSSTTVDQNSMKKKTKYQKPIKTLNSITNIQFNPSIKNINTTNQLPDLKKKYYKVGK